MESPTALPHSVIEVAKSQALPFREYNQPAGALEWNRPDASFRVLSTFTASIEVVRREFVDCRFAKRLGIVIPLRAYTTTLDQHVECVWSFLPPDVRGHAWPSVTRNHGREPWMCRWFIFF